MSVNADPQPSSGAAPPDASPWHARDVPEVADALGVSLRTGLGVAEAARRLTDEGANRLADAPRRPAWAVFLDQFRSLLIVVLIGAAVLAGLVGDLKDTIVISVVLLFNAVLGFVQEHRAERSLAALRQMLVASATARRDGVVREMPAETLVPGDVVLLEAGDRVPADGRLVVAQSLEIDEATLTGESLPVAKRTTSVATHAPLAERTSVAYMNTVVTRGRAELLVTATGMRTEIGKLARMLQEVRNERTPLQEQLHVLGKRLAVVAGVAVLLFFVLGIIRGQGVADTVLASVALAVAAIPEGLPAVVTVTLAVGVRQMAKRGAIVKRLASVETLGSTTVICSDKTGTLTLNAMTATAIFSRGERLQVSGHGYAAEGEIARPDGSLAAADVLDLLELAALCNDSEITDGAAIGDPTEAAFVALAAKAGVRRADVEQRMPRIAEVPFDSDRKFMATFHRNGAEVVVAVKGGADVLLRRCASVLDVDGVIPLDDPAAERVRDEIERLAGNGLRVLAIARRRLAADVVDGAEDECDRVGLVDELTLVGLIGLLDPPRTEARDAIRLCRRGGVAVKMITGDHAATAASIASQLDLRGGTLNGAELDAMSDDELCERVDETAVFARVTPEHKVRIVAALRASGHVVAMTGDGVNDAPALKSADIGVAMGITGTEVSKEAAAMVLTDDNFATIVRAVEAGRTIYDNILKFVRFQLSTNVGAILSLLGAQVAGLPVPFTAIQVLWVNLIMDGPPAMALGVDPPERGAMERPPRDPGERILTARRFGRIASHGAVMAVGTLGVLAVARERVGEERALTLAFTTFVLFQVFNAFNARSEHESAFHRDSLRNGKLWAALAVVVVLQGLAVHVSPFQDIFGTTDFTMWDWVIATTVSSSVLWIEEMRKAIARRRSPAASADLATD